MGELEREVKGDFVGFMGMPPELLHDLVQKLATRLTKHDTTMRQLLIPVQEHRLESAMDHIFNLGVPHSMFADRCALFDAVQKYIADASWRWNIGKKFQCMHWSFSRCLDALVKHGVGRY